MTKNKCIVCGQTKECIKKSYEGLTTKLQDLQKAYDIAMKEINRLRNQVADERKKVLKEVEKIIDKIDTEQYTGEFCYKANSLLRFIRKQVLQLRS